MAFFARTPAACPHRCSKHVEGEGGTGPQMVCKLVEQIVGPDNPSDERAVDMTVCENCCKWFEPSTDDWNPVVSSLILNRLDTIASPERAALIRAKAVAAIPVMQQEPGTFLPDKNAPPDVESAFEIEAVLPLPGRDRLRRSSDPFHWMVGITTSPRRRETLGYCLDSLHLAGWRASSGWGQRRRKERAESKMEEESETLSALEKSEMGTGNDKSEMGSEMGTGEMGTGNDKSETSEMGTGTSEMGTGKDESEMGTGMLRGESGRGEEGEIGTGNDEGEMGTGMLRGESGRGEQTPAFRQPQIFVFCDGVETHSDLRADARPQTTRIERRTAVGGWSNFVLSAHELVHRDPDAHAYMLLQDDAMLARLSGLREYVEGVMRSAGMGAMLSLYCSELDTQSKNGWHRLAIPMARGAQGFVFGRDAMYRFLADPITRPWEGPWHNNGARPLEQRGIDGNVGRWAHQRRVPLWIPTPSLVWHLGETSTLWPGAAMLGIRRAGDFLERHFSRAQSTNK